MRATNLVHCHILNIYCAFARLAETARKLGLINQKIKDVICDVYSMRNAIHLHAELRRGVTYDLNAAYKAYWHLKGFAKQIGDKMEKDSKATRPNASNSGSNKKTKTGTPRTSWFKKILAWCFSSRN